LTPLPCSNIPKELVLDGIKKRWDYISRVTKLSLLQFLHVVDLILSSTSFCFNEVFYEQIFGSLMGSPLSLILDIVMEDLEIQCLKKLDFAVKIFYRYVDDILAIIPRDRINNLLKEFNSFHPRLQFTYETESEGAINFLDITIIREGRNLLTNWYRKPTFPGKFVNFQSNHPYRYKINTIHSLVDRAVLLSDTRFHSTNLDIVKDILLLNSFPGIIILLIDIFATDSLF